MTGLMVFLSIHIWITVASLFCRCFVQHRYGSGER